MYLKKLELTNFRNYTLQTINFINGINLFIGNNAQGKTNIIESLYICAFGKSYRTLKDVELIQFDKEFCRINLDYIKNDVVNDIEIFIDNQNKKNIKANGIKILKLANHIGELPIVIFSPDSLDIVKGSPAKRRKFLDMICSQISKLYLINLQEYNKYLKLKNSLLKEEKFDIEYMNVINEKMSVYIYNIVNFRNNIIKKLLEKAKIIQKNITNQKESINLIYETEFLNLSCDQIKEKLNIVLYIEKLRKVSIKGIQRDDIKILINDLEVEKFGSQGQSRTALLTLKLANFELLKDDKGQAPILLLDDIMSELDKERINFLIKYIENYQSIITSTDSSFIKNIKNIEIYRVFNGTLEI